MLDWHARLRISWRDLGNLHDLILNGVGDEMGHEVTLLGKGLLVREDGVWRTTTRGDLLASREISIDSDSIAMLVYCRALEFMGDDRRVSHARVRWAASVRGDAWVRLYQRSIALLIRYELVQDEGDSLLITSFPIGFLSSIAVKPERNHEPRDYAWKHYPSTWNAIAARVRQEDGGQCVRCGTTPPDGRRAHHVHHIDRARRGGSHKPANLVTLCPTCHGTVEHNGVDFELPSRCMAGAAS